jgi:hypothetical protein
MSAMTGYREFLCMHCHNPEYREFLCMSGMTEYREFLCMPGIVDYWELAGWFWGVLTCGTMRETVSTMA